MVSWLAESPGSGVPVVISGAGGLGTTVLAVHAAYFQCDGFPDGRLSVDLGGTGAEPLDAHLVQFRLLRALGVNVDGISPADNRIAVSCCATCRPGGARF
ncbi:hypothetical protein ACWEOE_40270 [Amycolatopsis sp. NPDC004368]